MPDIKNLISQKISFVNDIDWLIVFSLLPLIIVILIAFVIMIANEI